VGSKTTVMFVKDLYVSRGQAGAPKPPGLKFYLFNQKQTVKKAPALSFRGLNVLVLGPDQDLLWRLAHDIYEEYKPGCTDPEVRRLHGNGRSRCAEHAPRSTRGVAG
jgi:hypothetical protein